MTFKTFLCVSTALVLLSVPTTLCAQEKQTQSNAAIKNIEMRLSAVEDQMRVLTGKVEKNAYLRRRTEDVLKRLQEDFDVRLTDLENAPSVVQEVQTESPPVSGKLGQVKMRDGEVTGAVSNPEKPALPEKPDDYGLTPQEMYDRAFGMLRQANYGDAEIAFRRFTEKYPEDKLTDNAKYWYAETFYVRGELGDAAVAFADAYQHDPAGAKAPDSLLKLAMSLAGVEKVKDACATLSALKAKYPKASSTIKDRAKQEWGRLKCK